MRKIININMAGRVIPIDEGAYENLQRYLDSLRKYFANEEGRDEIINDIESRIAELMSDKAKRNAGAIGEQDVQDIINSMGRVEDFEEVEADETHAFQKNAAGTTTENEGYTSRGRLYRNSSDKFIGGVCSGVASYLNIDPAIVRLLFAIITFGGFGSGIIIYLFLWIILPERPLQHALARRLFRNPDDRIIAGVAGGLGAYFHRSPNMFRLVFAGPLLINILVGVINGILFRHHGDFFPNVFVGSFTATFLVIYVVLWVLLPEATSEFEKMEMRGETIDVNRIRQNVRNTMDNFEGRMKEWGNEVRETAEQWKNRANQFASTQGKDWVSDGTRASRSAVRGIGHVIGVLFKAFFMFVAGCIVLALLGALLTVIFGGLASWQVTGFLFTSSWQQLLAWSTIILFFIVPLIALITWLVRRLVGVRSGSRYLSWTFGGLWTMGWVAVICLAASVQKDLSRYERVQQELPIDHPIDSVLNIVVGESPIQYSGDMDWIIDDDNNGWDIADDQIRYNNVRVRYNKSADSAYHIAVKKYSAGSSVQNAQDRAAATIFPVELHGDQLQLPAGLTILRAQKFRGQGVIVELQIPVGRKVRFDRSLDRAYNGWVVKKYNPYYGGHSRKGDWNDSEDGQVSFNKVYVMGTDGSLEEADKRESVKKSLDAREREMDSLEQEMQRRKEMDERARQKMEELRKSIREQRESSLRQNKEFDLYAIKAANPFALLFG